jgi:hypothetical protein
MRETVREEIEQADVPKEAFPATIAFACLQNSACAPMPSQTALVCCCSLRTGAKYHPQARGKVLQQIC